MKRWVRTLRGHVSDNAMSRRVVLAPANATGTSAAPARPRRRLNAQDGGKSPGLGEVEGTTLGTVSIGQEVTSLRLGVTIPVQGRIWGSAGRGRQVGHGGGADAAYR